MRNFCGKVFQCQGIFRRKTLDSRSDQQIQGVVIKATRWRHFSREQAYFSYAVGLIYLTLKTWGGSRVKPESGGEKKSAQTKKPRRFSSTGLSMYGGEIGIRTLGTGEGTTDFESVPFGHSGISPTARIITTLLPEANPLSEIFPCYQMLASIKAVRPDDWRLLRKLR